MPRLFGRDYTRDEFLRRVGQASQVGGVREYRIQGGPADGVHAADVYTGSGLRFTVLPGRGMDISHASYKGIPLCWISPAGEVSPWSYEPQGLGWLRTFAGGLLTTCGLTHIHFPEVVGDKSYGLHGRASTLVASNVQAGGEWKGDEYRLWVSGRTIESALFDEQMELQRTVSSELGSARLRIEDVVTNVGFRETPQVMLYHINMGFPVLGPDAELVLPSLHAMPGDINPPDDREGPYTFPEPRADYPNTVFDHQPLADENGMVHAALINENLGSDPLGVRISYRQAELPHLNEWKMLGLGEYVLGVEPASTAFGTREEMLQSGGMKLLAPGESVRYLVEIGVLDGESEVSEFKNRVKAVRDAA